MQAEFEIRPLLRRRASAAESIFAALVTRLEVGRLTVVLPDGSERQFVGPKPGPQAEVQVRHPRLFRRVLFGGDVGFAEAYIDGDCEVSDLTALIEPIAREKGKGPLSEHSELVDELGLASLDVMELIESIEDDFDLSFPLNALPDIRTVADLARQLEKLRNESV